MVPAVTSVSFAPAARKRPMKWPACRVQSAVFFHLEELCVGFIPNEVLLEFSRPLLSTNPGFGVGRETEVIDVGLEANLSMP